MVRTPADGQAVSPAAAGEPGTARQEALRVGVHTIDLKAGLLVDSRGDEVPLRPQAWALLALLARHAGEVVGKEQILQAVWPGRVVTNGAITQAVKDLRRALGTDGHACLKTAARRGYRLLARSVTTASADAVDSTAPGPPALPAMAGPLFGRDADTLALAMLLAQHRLVTVVGPAGVGKTAFALAAAHAEAGRSSDEVAWVDLARFTDPSLLATEVARALGLPRGDGETPLPMLRAALSNASGRLVLDNAEHLVEAVATLAATLLDAARGLRLLVTSQVPLGIETERLFRLAPLALPAAGASLAEVAASPAVAMFVDRARARDQRFALSADNHSMVAELCRWLDGLPLALRLAAGRVHMLGLSGLHAHLRGHLSDHLQWAIAPPRSDDLCGSKPGGAARLPTLAAALDWSYGLLAATEQELYRRLGVFVGGFTIELVVAANPHGGGREAVLALLSGLEERSLLDVDTADPPRYRLLECQREHALKELARGGLEAAARDAHAEAMLGAIQAGDEALWVTPDDDFIARWAPEVDNLRAAMAWSARQDERRCLLLVAAATALFRLLDLVVELRRVAQALPEPNAMGLDAAQAARCLLALSMLESGHCAERAEALAHRAEERARDARDARLLYLASCRRAVGTLVRPSERDALHARIAALGVALPPRLRCQRAAAEFSLHLQRGQPALALGAAQEGFALACQAGAQRQAATFANWTIVAMLDAGDAEAASEHAAAIRARLLAGFAGQAIPYLGTCARVALRRGRIEEAQHELRRMFERCRRVGWLDFDAFADLYVEFALAQRRADVAARLFGYARCAGQRAWGRLPTPARREALRLQLGAFFAPQQLEALLAQGATLVPEEVCVLVLGATASGRARVT